MPTAQVNGITVYYEVHGTGEPLVLIGGLGADITLVTPITGWLARLLLPLKWAGLLRGRHPQPRYAHLRQRRASVSYDASDRLGQIAAPTLILHGRRDKSMPLEQAEAMHAGIRGSQLEVFRGGHMFFLFTERDQFLDRVERFLAG